MDTAADLIDALTASAGPRPTFGHDPHPQPAVVNVSAGHEPLHVPGAFLAADLADRKYNWVLQRCFASETPWPAVPEFVTAAVGPLIYHYDGGRHSACYATGKYLGHAVAVTVTLQPYDGFSVTVAGTSETAVDRLIAGFAELLPAPPPRPLPERPDNVIPVAFWMQDPVSREAYSRHRDITVHRWTEVEKNYPSQVRDQAGALVTMGAPTGEGSGKLLLLHGPPGTGKTRFILTLLSEWRDWCTASVVTDSDRFFGDPTYLNSIVFGAAHMKDWLLLVVEDGDDFLNVGARDSKGQSIARLLNIGDGIVGQGINLLTLLTTNVPMEQLNPAIVRPGRALANVHFGPFPADEAAGWCTERGRPATFDGDEVTLAEMYAAIREDQQP